MDPITVSALTLLAAAAVTVPLVYRWRSRPAVSPPSDDPLIGTTLAGYRLVEKLGRGSMGSVYSGEPVQGSGPRVAVKVIHAQLGQTPLFVTRFEREARAGAQMAHPALVKVHARGCDGDTAFIVMDQVQGEPLSRRIRPDMPIPEALHYLRQLVDGMAYAHASGWVHRDLKPANVMVTSQQQVRILDFGIGRNEDLTALTKTGQVLGTMGYAAPEQIEGGRADARSDQYSLGVIAYELLFGRHPYRGKVSRMIAGEAATPLIEVRGDVPKSLSDLVARMMAWNPHDRFADLHEVLAALASFGESEADTMAEPPTTHEVFEPETTFDVIDPSTPRRADDPLPCLLVLTGSGAGRVHRLQRSELTLGRSQNADIGLDETGVSRRHAALKRTDATWSLTDLNSRNGTWVEEERVTTRVLHDGDRIRLGASVVLRFALQASAEAELQTLLFEQATRDPLTGASNRNHFDSRYQAALSLAASHGTPLSVLMLDIDHFKRINDTYGHPGGDAVLRDVVVRLTMHMRREDHLARYGGEEFVMLARMGRDEASHLAERLRAAIASTPFQVTQGVEVKNIDATVSIGVACLGPSQDDPREVGRTLLREADEALYRAKNGGRNQVQVA